MKPLTYEEISAIAPATYTEIKDPKRSEKYSHIPTSQIVTALNKEGFLATKVIQGKKDEYGKHVIRFRHKNDMKKKDVNEIVIVNAHNGRSSLQFMGGRFRIVCGNDLIVYSPIVEPVIARHQNLQLDNVIEGVFTIVKEFDEINKRVELMQSVQLDPYYQSVLAYASAHIRFGDYLPVDPKVLLTVRRDEDKANDLWTVFNRIQENVIRGGHPGLTVTNKKMTTRKIESIKGTVNTNKYLWAAAEKVAELAA